MKKLLIIIVGVLIIWIVVKNVKVVPVVHNTPEMACWDGAGECVETGKMLHQKEWVTVYKYFGI